jgi:hypothetical protein
MLDTAHEVRTIWMARTRLCRCCLDPHLYLARRQRIGSPNEKQKSSIATPGSPFEHSPKRQQRAQGFVDDRLRKIDACNPANYSGIGSAI